MYWWSEVVVGQLLERKPEPKAEENEDKLEHERTYWTHEDKVLSFMSSNLDTSEGYLQKKQ